MHEITVSLNAKIIFRCHDHILYIRLPNHGYNVPGGHLETGEAPLEALRRELKEELDFELTEDPQLVGVWADTKPGKPARLLIGYVLDLPEQRQFTYQEPDEPGGECVWIHKNDIPSIGMNKKFAAYTTQAANFKL